MRRWPSGLSRSWPFGFRGRLRRSVRRSWPGQLPQRRVFAKEQGHALKPLNLGSKVGSQPSHPACPFHHFDLVGKGSPSTDAGCCLAHGRVAGRATHRGAGRGERMATRRWKAFSRGAATLPAVTKARFPDSKVPVSCRRFPKGVALVQKSLLRPVMQRRPRFLTRSKSNVTIEEGAG